MSTPWRERHFALAGSIARAAPPGSKCLAKRPLEHPIHRPPPRPRERRSRRHPLRLQRPPVALQMIEQRSEELPHLLDRRPPAVLRRRRAPRDLLHPRVLAELVARDRDAVPLRRVPRALLVRGEVVHAPAHPVRHDDPKPRRGDREPHAAPHVCERRAAVGERSPRPPGRRRVRRDRPTRELERDRAHLLRRGLDEARARQCREPLDLGAELPKVTAEAHGAPTRARARCRSLARSPRAAATSPRTRARRASRGARASGAPRRAGHARPCSPRRRG